MNRQLRHYRIEADSYAAGYARTYCGRPIVADCAQIAPGEWQPAYSPNWRPADIKPIPVCPECERHEKGSV